MVRVPASSSSSLATTDMRMDRVQEASTAKSLPMAYVQSPCLGASTSADRLPPAMSPVKAPPPSGSDRSMLMVYCVGVHGSVASRRTVPLGTRKEPVDSPACSGVEVSWPVALWYSTRGP